jgi:type IX secretion system PorP/SprF family membrane protein
MKKLYFLVLLFASIRITAQNAGFIETYPQNKLGYNPAFSGNENKMKITTIGQYGANNKLGSLKNYYLAAEIPIFKAAGIALQYSDYSYNLTKNKILSINIAKHIKFNAKTSLSYGITTGIADTRLDYESDYGISYLKESKSAFDSDKINVSKSSINPNEQIQKFAENQYLLGAGIYFNADKWHFGFSVPNIIKNKSPKDAAVSTKIDLDRPAFLSIERDFQLNKTLDLKTGGLYRFSKNTLEKGLDIQTSLWLNKKYSLGLWYQKLSTNNCCENNPILATSEIVVKKVRLGYSVKLKDNKNYTNVKQAVMLRIDIDYLKNKKNK